jgi:hypothetical protein
MEEAPANSKQSLHSASASAMNDDINHRICFISQKMLFISLFYLFIQIIPVIFINYVLNLSTHPSRIKALINLESYPPCSHM